MAKKEETKKKKALNPLLKNFIAGVIFVGVMLLAIFITLRVMTQHDLSVSVPDLVGMSVEDANRVAQDSNISLIITDSVFVSRFPRGAVFAQNPRAATKVKRGRKIYLTVNAMRDKQVVIPDLVGFSMRQAKVELNTRGLKLGRLIYVNDMATNCVIAQLMNGVEVEPGKKVDIGSTVDLKLGLNPENGYTHIPDMGGLQNARAVSYLKDNSLNLAELVFDRSVKTYTDTLNAFVYRQAPEQSEVEVLMGTSVKLYLTVDESKRPVKEDPASEEVEQCAL